jgi:hypothetical protein
MEKVLYVNTWKSVLLLNTLSRDHIQVAVFSLDITFLASLCACVCVRACVRASVRVRAHTHACKALVNMVLLHFSCLCCCSVLHAMRENSAGMYELLDVREGISFVTTLNMAALSHEKSASSRTYHVPCHLWCLDSDERNSL